jgi:hypothetical protein
MKITTIISMLFLLAACGGQNEADIMQREVIEAKTTVGIENPGLDYATQLEIVRELSGPKLCAAALPLQSIGEMFVLNDDQTDISFFSGFRPNSEDTDVVKLISNEIGLRINSNMDQCIGKNRVDYHEATAICFEEAKRKDQFWFNNTLKIEKKCAIQAEQQGLCKPFLFGGMIMSGSTSIIGDCGCTKKTISAVCGAEFTSKTNIRKLINHDFARKNRDEAKRKADEKRRERGRFLQNYTRSLKPLFCTATEVFPGSTNISCY